MNLLILGAGGHGKVCAEIARKTYEKISFLDDNSADAIGKVSEIENFVSEYDEIFVAFGNPKIRKEWLEKAKALGYQIATIISEKSLVSKFTSIGEGSVIMGGAIIQTGASLGSGVIISASAVVDHDAIVKDYCHINVGAIVASGAAVEEMTKVGYGEVYV